MSPANDPKSHPGRRARGGTPRPTGLLRRAAEVTPAMDFSPHLIDASMGNKAATLEAQALSPDTARRTALSAGRYPLRSRPASTTEPHGPSRSCRAAWDLGHGWRGSPPRGPEHRHSRDCSKGGNRATARTARCARCRRNSFVGGRASGSRVLLRGDARPLMPR